MLHVTIFKNPAPPLPGEYRNSLVMTTCFLAIQLKETPVNIRY
jgi:hypothetical protein